VVFLTTHQLLSRLAGLFGSRLLSGLLIGGSGLRLLRLRRRNVGRRSGALGYCRTRLDVIGRYVRR